MMIKQTLILLMLVLCSWKSYSQEIDFSEHYYYFPLVEERLGVVSHDFDFMNTGERELIIKEVLVSCGCMTSEWPKKPVLPGEKATVRLSYDPVNRLETEFLGVAEVYTNAGVVHLKIEGKVKRERHEFPEDYHLQAGNHIAPETTTVAGGEFDLILSRIRKELLQRLDPIRNDAAVLNQVALLRRGGYWPDLDYKCYARTNWEPVCHLDRVTQMAYAYISPESKYFANDTLFLAIRDALAFWVRQAPKSHNWWFNQIAVPQHLGDIFVLLAAGKQKLPDELQAGLYGMMAWPDPRKWTGANKQDIALHHLQRGCLLENDSIVRMAVEQLFYPLRFTNREGLQVDYSYQQHGNQLYIGGYGTVFVNCVMRTADWLRHTSYALGDEQLQLFSRFVRETYLNVFRGSYLDYSVMGRGVSRKGVTYAGDMSGFLEKMKRLDPEHAAEYEENKARFSGNRGEGRSGFSRIYWRSDYALHNRPEFDFSVRTSSVRTWKIEAGNGENLLGALLSDGATCLRVSGDEYFDIFPLWNWNCIPGVTAPEKGNVLEPAGWGTRGKAVFSGGVSDGCYSVMAYDMDDFGVKARKSWFMFDREVVCLGAGICKTTAGRVLTTVDQVRYDRARSSGNRILHRNILYYFPYGNAGDTVFTVKRKSWADINYNESLELLDGEMYHIYIDHGERPEQARYAYILVPGVSDFSDYDSTAVAILRNDALMQAVYQKKLDVLQLICYEAGRFEGQELELEVDIPCVVMVRGVCSQNPELYLSDPMQNKKQVKICYTNRDKRVERVVDLPGDDRKGSTIKIEIR